MTNDYFLLGDAAKVLNCPPYRITYLLMTRRVPEPMRIGGRRVFTIADLTRIAEILKLDITKALEIRGRR